MFSSPQNLSFMAGRNLANVHHKTIVGINYPKIPLIVYIFIFSDWRHPCLLILLCANSD